MRFVRRWLFGVVVLLACAVAFGPVGAAKAARNASIVMDMRTGKVIYSRNADRRQHPASLTKLMTLYLTFEAIRNGQLRLDQKLRVSRKAARQPPSKLGLRAGQRVTVRHLIRAAAIKSANDAAMVLAEGIAGSEAAFGRLMTQKARAIGMARTTFKNPHGLTRPGHLSTARDMALLGRRLYFDFPSYYNVFGRKKANAAGRTVYTTNRLLRSYAGAEGMKTGYTSAAGYNLIAAAKRGQRRVLAVVLGGTSSGTRNREMRRLLDMGFRKTPKHAREVPPALPGIQVADAPLPPARPGTRATGLAALQTALSSQAVAATAPVRTTDTGTRIAPKRADLPKRRPGARQKFAEGNWTVQLGAFRSEALARASITSAKLAKIPLLASGRPMVETAKARSGKRIYKARVTGLNPATAKAACAQVQKTGHDCLALAPK